MNSRVRDDLLLSAENTVDIQKVSGGLWILFIVFNGIFLRWKHECRLLLMPNRIANITINFDFYCIFNKKMKRKEKNFIESFDGIENCQLSSHSGYSKFICINNKMNREKGGNPITIHKQHFLVWSMANWKRIGLNFLNLIEVPLSLLRLIAQTSNH